MAEAVVSFVLEQLGEFLVEFVKHEAKFLCGVRDRVERAKAELRRMRCYLKDADARARGGDERVRNWVAEIREATYDLEDAILTYAKEVTDLRREGGFRNVLKRLAGLFCEGVKLRRAGSKIGKISNDISSLRSSLEAYGIRELQTSGSDSASSSDVRRRELRRDYSHIVEPDIVGLDEDVNKLVACLTESGDSHRVVSICGMGGLGKTTLARKVYQHNKIRGQFDCVAWASISQQCQVSSVWKDLLIKVSPDDKSEIRDMKDVEMCRKLYEILKVRKCLIMLDDIWTAEVWQCLSPAFPRDETRSKLLLTTRNRDLGLYADENGVIHEPRCLDDEESWELFEKVFRSQSRSSHEELKRKKELGREMLEHCGGLPLAIVVLRGLLSRKQSLFEWEAMHKNVKTYINKGNLFEIQGSQISGVSWVLGLSYDELPYHLRPCFMQLANFPEDHEIKVRELCQIWMAEGFVPSEEVGYECLHELVQRCMVLRGKMGSIDGRIKTCRIHDLMRDLCLLKAQEENFVKVFDCLDRQEDMDSLSSTKVRRVAITFRKRNSVEEILPINKDCFLRSFICCDAHLISAVMKSLTNHFHMLRVLKLENCIVFFPKEIGKLIHFHFLSLKNSRVNLLPESIWELRYLQILDLRISSLFLMHRDIAVLRLDQLKHLFLPSERVLCKCLIGFENSRNLQTLAGILTSYFTFNLLAQLKNLTKLEVYFDESWEGGVVFNSLRSLVVTTRPKSFNLPFDREKHDVTPIILSCPQICKLKIRFMSIENLPEASQFSQELVKLTLDETFVNNDPMCTLEKLPKLRILCLVRCEFAVGEIVCSSGGFPCLESLCFSKLSMKEWRVEKGALPNLWHLNLDKCYRLTTFPDCLQYLTSLKEVVLGKHESNLINRLKEREKLRKLPGDLQFLLLNGRSRQSDEEFDHT